MAKRTNATKRTTKTKAEWEEELSEAKARANEHLAHRNEGLRQIESLTDELAKTRKELDSFKASQARATGEVEGLKLAMRMLSKGFV